MAFLLRHFLKSLRDSFVCMAEAFFKSQDFFSNHREPKVTRLDGACVDRTHCDLMDSIAFYLDEWIRLRVDWKLLAPIEIPAQRK